MQGWRMQGWAWGWGGAGLEDAEFTGPARYGPRAMKGGDQPACSGISA